MKQTHLITNFYIDGNAERQVELDHCMRMNLANSIIDKFTIILDLEAFRYFVDKIKNDSKIKFIVEEKRPVFNTFFDFTKKDYINIISNTDIYFNETLEKAKIFYSVPENKNTCMAICRWDINEKGEAIHYNHSDSQDCWIFDGEVKQMNGADFRLGIRGCDNSIAHIISNNGYTVINPSQSIQTMHCHLSGVRNYSLYEESDLVRPPYLTIQPTSL